MPSSINADGKDFNGNEKKDNQRKANSANPLAVQGSNEGRAEGEAAGETKPEKT